MDAKKFVEQYGRAEAAQVAQRAGTTLEYFMHFVYGYAAPSRRLAIRLVKASGGRLGFMELIAPKDHEWAQT